jgi:hypothetical protein
VTSADLAGRGRLAPHVPIIATLSQARNAIKAHWTTALQVNGIG